MEPLERCLEEISASVLDAREAVTCRSLAARARVDASTGSAALAQFAREHASDGDLAALELVVRRLGAGVGKDGDQDTKKAQLDPRSRVICLSSVAAVAVSEEKSDGVLCKQVYALYQSATKAGEEEAGKEAAAIACWSQELKARNEVFADAVKHMPLSAAAKAFYASGVSCAEATARKDFGDEQGEETVSAFDVINAPTKKTTKSSAVSSSKSFFKSNGQTGFSKSSKKSSSPFKPSSTSHDNRKKEVKISAASMNNVLTVDSDDEEDEEEDDAPVFIKKANGSSKRVISDDEDEDGEEDQDEETPQVAPKSTKVPKAAATPAKSRNVKRKLNASPAEPKSKPTRQEDSGSEDEAAPRSKKPRSDSEEEEEASEPSVPSKRRVLVTKTRINEEGYMVTEKTYEEVELTAEELAKEREAAKKKQQQQKAKAAAEKEAKAKKAKQSGPAKQRDLRSFFMKQ